MEARVAPNAQTDIDVFQFCRAASAKCSRRVITRHMLWFDPIRARLSPIRCWRESITGVLIIQTPAPAAVNADFTRFA